MSPSTCGRLASAPAEGRARGSLEAVSPIGIRSTTRRLRRHMVGMVLVVALSGAIAAHHSGIAMGEMHHDGMSAAVEMCVGAFVAVGSAVAAVAIGILALGRWPTLIDLAPADALTHPRTCAPAARAGPLLPLARLCVWRR
jgi:hypothetical protein